MKENQALEYAKAKCRLADEDVSPEELVEEMAFVFLTPARIFKVWLQAIRHLYL